MWEPSIESMTMDMDTSVNVSFIGQLICATSLGMVLGWTAYGLLQTTMLDLRWKTSGLHLASALNARPWYRQWARCLVALIGGAASATILWEVTRIVLAKTLCTNCCG